MSMGYETRYKDCAPMKTIGRLRGILSGLEILTRETWYDDVEGYHSLFLEARDVGLYANGKGTTPAYALASAYAEFMERLENLVFVTNNMVRHSKRDQAARYRGFCIAPDEKGISAEELAGNHEHWLEPMLDGASGMEEKLSILKAWESTDDYLDGEGFLALPYTNLTNGRESHIPVTMLVNIYMSNGMCAGNTRQEALVQGLSEVIERYAQKTIVSARLTPPDIPASYIAVRYPHLYGMIQRLEAKGDYRVIVKDCSLGKGLPVTAVILTDRKSHSSYVRFGAHPAFDIALERSLTELLQGKHLHNTMWLSRLAFSEEDIFSRENALNMITNGIAYYPAELFTGKESYPFSGSIGMSGNDNQAMLSYLTALLRDEGFDILIRDVSFLGFPSYHIVVPFMSELMDSGFMPIQKLLRLRSQGNRRIPDILKRLGAASEAEIREVILWIEEWSTLPDSSPAKWINDWFGVDFPWTRLKRELFLSMAYFRIGDYGNAARAMEQYVRTLPPSSHDTGSLYYSCIRDFFYGLAHWGGNADLLPLLSKFYPDKMANKVVSDLADRTEVFKNCSGLDCFHCEACSYRRQCKYPAKEALYLKLKDAYARNAIVQCQVNAGFICEEIVDSA